MRKANSEQYIPYDTIFYFYLALKSLEENILKC